MKFCIHCKQEHPTGAFHKDASTPDGLRRWCKSCTNEAGRKIYHGSPENKARVFKRYGITEAQYKAIRNVQGQVCAICGASPERLVVDHDHATGYVRGLLCRPCNFMLGNSKESPDMLRRAAEYLELRLSVPMFVSWQQAQNILNDKS